MSNMPQTKLLLSISLIALTSTGALAQDDTRQTFLGTITLDGSENPTAPLEGIVAAGSATTKTGTTILETQASVSVVARAFIEEIGAANLAETFGYSAGIITENYGGDPRFDSLYLRGFNLENDKFLDGLRLMRSTQYPTSAPTFELYGLERIEVLRGPASVLYGAGTPAGLVNFVQKRAQADGDFTETGFSFDSNQSWAVFGDANRVVDDRFAYRVTGKVGDRQTDVEGIGSEGGYLGLSASYMLTDATELEFMASYHDDEPISPTGIPNGFVGVYDLDDLRDFNFADEDFNTSDRKMTTLSFGVTHEFDSGWKLNGNFRYTNFDWQYQNIYLGSSAGSVANRGVITQDETFKAFAFDLRLSGEAETGAVLHKLVIGVDAQTFDEDAFTRFSDIDPIDYTSPAYGSVVLGATTYEADKTVDASQVGIYAVDEMEMGNWRATVGLRHEWTEQDGQNGTTDFARDDTATTGHVGIGYVFDQGIATYLSYSTSYLPQIGADINGDLLKPTEGEQWELGVKWEPTNFDGLFTAALFDLTEKNRTTVAGPGFPAPVVQTGEVSIQGLELEALAELGSGWKVKGAYTWMDTKISGDNDGNELANTPESSASLWLSKEVMSGLTLGGGVRYIGERWAEDANVNKLDAVTLVDLGASYEFGDGFTARLNVNNVTDEAYISAIGFSSSYIGDGRNVQASLTYKW